MNPDTVLTKEQMVKIYGDFYSNSFSFEFDELDVPPSLQCLIPYAEFWAFQEEDRYELVELASIEIRSNLQAVVLNLDDEIDEWFESARKLDVRPDAYYAISYLRMCADYVDVIDSKK